MAPSLLSDKSLSQTLAANLFASSIVPYAGFLYHLHRSQQAPRLTLFGFYWLLVFVGVTIPAGIIGAPCIVKLLRPGVACLTAAWSAAKTQYHTSLSNVDYLHGGAESMLTLTNFFIVLGLRQGLRKEHKRKQQQAVASEQLQEQTPASKPH